MLRYATLRLFGPIIGLTILSKRMVNRATRSSRYSRFILHASGKCRRFWLVNFQKAYVEQQLSKRQGDCHQCGACCSMLVTCPMLTKEGNCLSYGTCRPTSCKVFPVDQRDINEVSLCGVECGYRFNLESPTRRLELGKGDEAG